MKKRYIIANLEARKLREVEAQPPPDSVEGGIGPQNLEAGRTVVGVNGVREVRPNPILPRGVKLAEGEVIFDGERETIDWETGEAIELVEPLSSYTYREFLALKEQVESLSERVAALEKGNKAKEVR